MGTATQQYRLNPATLQKNAVLQLWLRKFRWSRVGNPFKVSISNEIQSKQPNFWYENCITICYVGLPISLCFNKATCPSSDDSVMDNVHISDSGWETNRHDRPGLFWHITQRSHPFSHFSHQKSVAVSRQGALRQSCGDAQPYLPPPPESRASDPTAEWTNPWPLVKIVRAKNLHVNCTDHHMPGFRRFKLRIWAQIPRFSSGRVNGAESCLIDWQSCTRTRNMWPFMGYGDSLLCS